MWVVPTWKLNEDLKKQKIENKDWRERERERDDNAIEFLIIDKDFDGALISNVEDFDKALIRNIGVRKKDCIFISLLESIIILILS